MTPRSSRFTKLSWSNTLALLLGLVLLAGCGGGAGLSGTATSGASATAGASSVAQGLAGAAKVDDASDFVALAPVEQTAPRTASGQLKVLIGLRGQASKADESYVASKGGTVVARYRLVNAMAATVPESAIAALKADPRVAVVEPDLPVYSTGVEVDSTWGVKRIGAGTVQAGGNRGTGIKVAIIDTGIDYTHPELAPNYAGGYDFVNNDADPKDDNGHGTHVAGTVAAREDGVGVVGVAPEARLYAVKVLDAAGSGSFSTVISAMQWCVDNQIQVANLSLGSPSNPGTLVEDAFKKAQTAGIITVAAAGNSGTIAGTEDNVGYPARYDSVIAVAATDSSDVRAYYSCTGPKVEVAAPGSSISSCKLGGGYVTMSGTSMATPHVAGAIALALKAGRPASEIRTRLQQTSLDLGAAGRDTWYGFGRVRAEEMCAASNTAPAVTIQSPAANATFASGASVTFSGAASDFQDGTISSSLVWTVNGVTYTGAGFSATLPDGTYTATATATDAGGLSGSASVTFSVANTAPVVKITAPTAGATLAAGSSVTFAGSATDTEDGTISSNLVWTLGSTVIGRGASFSTTALPSGSCVVVATVTDSKGATRSASVSFTMATAALGTKVVTDQPSYVNKQTATITTSVTGYGVALRNATVAVSIITAKGLRYGTSGKTGSNGQFVARFTVNSSTMGVGTYTVNVTASCSGFQNGTASTTFTVTR